MAAPEISGLRPGLKRLAKKTRPESIKADAPVTGPGSEKYQRILDAAVEVIAEHGYFSSPVSAIAKRAGVADAARHRGNGSGRPETPARCGTSACQRP